jgi:hypothetical protein
MKEIVDRLSRDMAQGVSRRKALWMFLAGSGVLGVFGVQKASASPLSSKLLCTESCVQQAEAFLDLCITASRNGPNGYCAEFTLIKVNSTQLKINSTLLNVNSTAVYVLDEFYTPVR